MTEHDALYFVKGLHDFIEAGVANKGEWCWPTRDLVNENLNLNRDLLGDQAVKTFSGLLGNLRRKRWATIEGCTPHCHAPHIKLTGAGLAALEWMNERGCSVHQGRGRKGTCHAHERLILQRKVA